MDDIVLSKIHTADRAKVSITITVAAYKGKVFFFVVEEDRPPYNYFDVDLPIHKGA